MEAQPAPAPAQPPGVLQNVQDNVTNAAEAISNNISSGLTSAKSGIDNAINDFSSNQAVQATSSFLDANTMIAKFAFLILVVAGFIILFNLGMQLLGYFLSTNPNPYLIQGKINPRDGGKIIHQDPHNKDAIIVPRSNNALTGIEFTWSVWLLYNPPVAPSDRTLNDYYEPVFIKGDNSLANADLSSGAKFTSLNNGPGLYFGPPSNKDVDNNPQANSLWILMDTMPIPSKDSVTASDNTEYIEITKVPMNKFFHVAIRCQNKYIDVYVNGTVVFRKNLVNVPKQNYYDVHVCPSPAYDGYLSDLRYFSSALTVVDINSIVVKGPNMNNSVAVGLNQNVGYSYLSNIWYNQFLH